MTRCSGTCARASRWYRRSPRRKTKDESYKYLTTASKFDPAQITGDYYSFLKGDDLIAVGGAPEALRIARRYRELGADQVLFFLQYGAIPHEQIMRSIEILGEKVLPEIQSWPTPGGITICEPHNEQRQ